VAPVTCVGCGAPLHPERRYPYCTAPACVKEHARGVRVVSIGVNKSNPVLVAETTETRRAVAAGETKDARRASYGPRTMGVQSAPVRVYRTPRRVAPRLPGSPAQQRLVRLYVTQGLTPQQVREKLRRSLSVREIQAIALSR
jgi:hypothetical protein